jgi:translocation protein SEC63
LKLRIEEPPVQEHQSEDDISDPEEDSLAGQMAMLKGAKVKKKAEEEDDESSTDDDVDEDSSSDSDSD